MPIEPMFGNLTREEALEELGIPDAGDPKLVALAALSWGGSALKVIRTNATENGWEFQALSDWDTEIKAPKFSVGDEAEQGVDPVFVAKRVVGNEVTTSGHAFSDSSVVDRAGPAVAYNSFESRIQVEGAEDYVHFAGFQVNGLIGTSGTTDEYFAYFASHQIANGTVTVAYGFKVYSPILSSGGAIGTLIGLHIEDLAGATTRYAIKQDGAQDLNQFAGRIDVANYISVSDNDNPPTTGKRLVFNFNPAFNAGAGAGNLICADFGTTTRCEAFYDALKHSFRISETDVFIITGTGLSTTQPLTVPNASGLKIQDTDASHTLGIVGGSNLTANRTLTLTTGDASRTLTMTGDASISGTNTGDQTSVTGNAGTATALQTARTIDGQSFDGTANITVIAPGTHAASSKATPVDADELPLVDSAASNVLKRLTWANLKATLKSYFDTLYQPLAAALTALSSATTGAWTAFAPTVTASSGTFTTVSASGSYARFGNVVFFQMTITITTAGTATGTLRATLPTTANSVATFAGRENTGTGFMVQGNVSAASNVLSIMKYDNTTIIADTRAVRISGTYESQ